MNLKIAKELLKVFEPMMSQEETWHDLPVLEMAEFVKTCVKNSNVQIRQMGAQCYKELYRTTKGKITEVKDIIEIDGKNRKILDAEVEDLVNDDNDDTNKSLKQTSGSKIWSTPKEIKRKIDIGQNNNSPTDDRKKRPNKSSQPSPATPRAKCLTAAHPVWRCT